MPTYEFRNNEATNDFSYPEINIASQLMDSWVNRCKYRVTNSVGYFADVKSIFLKITTEDDE